MSSYIQISNSMLEPLNSPRCCVSACTTDNPTTLVGVSTTLVAVRFYLAFWSSYKWKALLVSMRM